jgi:prepilin-type N-terminal cleavage/methylation domain-containing protein
MRDRVRALRDTKGFTLVEMMVVIIIAGILAAGVVSLYTGYMEKSKITEATSIIGAIITSEKLEMQRVPYQGFYTALTIEDFKKKGLDLSDTKYFTYKVEASDCTPCRDFKVTATATDYFTSEPVKPSITYTFSTKKWESECPDPTSPACISPDMLPQ